MYSQTNVQPNAVSSVLFRGMSRPRASKTGGTQAQNGLSSGIDASALHICWTPCIVSGNLQARQELGVLPDEGMTNTGSPCEPCAQCWQAARSWPTRVEACSKRVQVVGDDRLMQQQHTREHARGGFRTKIRVHYSSGNEQTCTTVHRWGEENGMAQRIAASMMLASAGS